MASLAKLVHCSLLLSQVIFLLLISPSVLCDEDDDNLLQGLNSYRTAQKLPPFTKNDKADCLADQIADKLEDEPCTNVTSATTAVPGAVPLQLTNYEDLLSKCKIDRNNTRGGLILPVCVPKRVSTLVLTNYTRTGYARYLNDSIYTGAGVGSEDDWVVVVLSTNTRDGSFAAGGAESVAVVGLGVILFGLLCNLLVL